MEKEQRVFYLSVDHPDSCLLEEIRDWHDADELPEKAKKFIKEAERLGFVYSLLGFIDDLNTEEIYPDEYYFFCTNKY